MKIEVGKKYRRRDGVITEIVLHDTSETNYPFKSSDADWYAYSGYFWYSGKESSRDLIEEVTEPTPHTAETTTREQEIRERIARLLFEQVGCSVTIDGIINDADKLTKFILTGEK